MWDDLPKKMPAGNKALLIILTIVVLAAIVFVIYTIYENNNKTACCQSSPSPTLDAKISGSPIISPSIKVSSSPTISLSPSGTPNLQIPEGETYVIFSSADTNGDKKDETLVVTKMSSGKYHAYILSNDGKILWENKELDRPPVRIATQTYNINENYLSWMLVFTEQSGDLAFIHWNGIAYEIPQNELGI